jgi:hypothetical protein
MAPRIAGTNQFEIAEGDVLNSAKTWPGIANTLSNLAARDILREEAESGSKSAMRGGSSI